ncbi:MULTISPECIES: cobalamin biosynthesis protein [Pseudomonas]|uniref:Cobalamin biosynthesis protein n=1 Tax=Pseudomonas sp. Hg7Tf TaxID=3236988 RepID=A0AB39IAD6_9PSED|nr:MULTISPECIES: cobalamin biosynthesis protein [Pseudomonas]KJK05362.1 cobalamin biosynthesis protein CobE [Pseudomonas sp. 5]MDD1979509.1 cobalamin biosynthesis protein [Pseudomonas putida]MDH2561811.1 cobalamin biosynthesis protein [Pseudomonas sp. Hg5Tf]QYX48942.1 cobalamin biosynthesis protein [Pseudomonas sp. S11A 273]
MPLFVGLGCRRGCPVETLGNLLVQTLKAHNLPLTAVAGLASIDLKHDEPGLQQLAQQLNVPLLFFSAAHLAPFEQRLSHRSVVAYQHSGCYGVAESAALALAEQLAGPAHLRITRTLCADASLALATVAAFGR